MVDKSAPDRVKLPPKPQVGQKKKKKNPADKPQPAWLFPPDEENSILNPKPKTDEAVKKEASNREKALEYMKRRVHAAPDRPAPPPQLLTLVGIFLTDYGFNSTSRLFTNERKARQQLNGWEDALGQKIEKGTPTLESIYRDWYRDFQIAKQDETSASESESSSEGSSDSESGDLNLAQDEAKDISDDDSEASSDGFGGSDVEMKEVPLGKKRKGAPRPAVSSSASSTSDSDADYEEESRKLSTATGLRRVVPHEKTASTTATVMVNTLKRKAAPSSSESSASEPESDAESSAEEKAPMPKKTKLAIAAPTGAPSKSPISKKQAKQAKKVVSVESSSSESSDSELDAPPPVKSLGRSGGKAGAQTKKVEPTSAPSSNSSSSDSDAPTPKTTSKGGIPQTSVQATSSDSSVTIDGDSKMPSASASSVSDNSSATSSSASAPETPGPSKESAPHITKKKHQGARPTPLAALSATAGDENMLSNKYQSYEYADRAYKDLSVTRGKGFTKEKNKKKRGSYRGGAIDTSGGKSFKFD